MDFRIVFFAIEVVEGKFTNNLGTRAIFLALLVRNFPSDRVASVSSDNDKVV